MKEQVYICAFDEHEDFVKAFVGDTVHVILKDGVETRGVVTRIDKFDFDILVDNQNHLNVLYSETSKIYLVNRANSGENYETEDQMVSHPRHYQSETGLEVIDVIEAFTADLMGIEATDTGNVIKYICRWKHKNGIQDLEKAMWYLQHLINKVKHNTK